MRSLSKYSQALVMIGRCKCLLLYPNPTSIATLTLGLGQWQTSTPLIFNGNTNALLPLSCYPSIIAGPNCNRIIRKWECSYKNPVNYAYLKWAGLRSELMPKHVNLILDGTRRWCQKNGVELTYVHFYRKNIMLAELCIKLGIPTVSCSMFATCNWNRSQEAINLILRELQESLEDNLKRFIRKGIKVTIIGQKWRLPKSLQDTVKKVEEATKEGKRVEMIYQVSYGGRWDIVETARSISSKVMSGEIEPEDANEALVEEQLSSSSFRNPDLMIRCGGKQRFSNFYVWQLAHTQLYFSDLVHFDFGQDHFLNALRWFQTSERRFGK